MRQTSSRRLLAGMAVFLLLLVGLAWQGVLLSECRRRFAPEQRPAAIAAPSFAATAAAPPPPPPPTTTTTTIPRAKEGVSELPFVRREAGEPLVLTWDYTADIGSCDAQNGGSLSRPGKLNICRGSDADVAANTDTIPATVAALAARTRVIAMPQSAARWTYVQRNISAVLPGLQIAPAVHGAALDNETLTLWAARGLLQSPPYSDQNGRLAYKKAACSISHMRVWEEVANAAHAGEYALVLEDDALISPADVPRLMNLLRALAAYKWDLAIVEQHPSQKELWEENGIPAGENLNLLYHGLYGNTAYFVSRRGARRMLQCFLPLRRWQDLVIAQNTHASLCLFTPADPLAYSLGVTNGKLAEGQIFESSIDH